MEHVSKEMLDFFFARTEKHIHRVALNLYKFANRETLFLNIPRALLISRAKEHDHSKYTPWEFPGYVFLTWKLKCQNEKLAYSYPDPSIEQMVSAAIHHHVTTNLHHSDAHASPDAMKPIDIVEMVCDWTAMSQEFGKTSCIEYVNANMDRKWNFSTATRDLIYQVIAEMDKLNNA